MSVRATLKNVRGVLLLCVGALAATTAVAAQEQQFWTSDPRPLGEAIKRIVGTCRCEITYEDPVYLDNEVLDVTAQMRKPPTGVKVLVPNEKPFMFFHDPTRGRQSEDEVLPHVEDVLKSFHASSPRRFHIERSEGVIHVVPDRGSILERRISVPEANGTVDVLLLTVLEQVNRGSSAPLEIGTVPSGLFHTTKATLPAQSSERADVVLARVIHLTHRKASWRLTYDPTFKKYVLNVELADPASCTGIGTGMHCDPGDDPALATNSTK